MASFTNLLLVVFGIQLLLITLGVSDVPGNALYQFVTNPTNWDSSLFFSLINDSLLAIGGTLAFIGLFVYKSDFVVFAGLVTTFLSFGKGLGNLYGIISAQVGSTFANLTIAPIIIIYCLALLGFWRGRNS